jgi:hypothetical protein
VLLGSALVSRRAFADVSRLKSSVVPASEAIMAPASVAGAPGTSTGSPERWMCPNETSVNVEFSSPRSVSFACASLREVIGEYNRYATWQIAYAGPDSGPLVNGTITPDPPSSMDGAVVDGVVELLNANFGVEVRSLDRSARTIWLLPLHRARAIPARKPAPRSLNIDRESDGQDLMDCDDFKFDDGRDGTWCRDTTVGRLLNAYNRHSEWQLSLVDPRESRFSVDALFANNDLQGVLRYLKSDCNLIEGSRSKVSHMIRLVKGAPAGQGN